jgi:hypothetical protein
VQSKSAAQAVEGVVCSLDTGPANGCQRSMQLRRKSQIDRKYPFNEGAVELPVKFFNGRFRATSVNEYSRQLLPFAIALTLSFERPVRLCSRR